MLGHKMIITQKASPSILIHFEWEKLNSIICTANARSIDVDDDDELFGLSCWLRNRIYYSKQDGFVFSIVVLTLLRTYICLFYRFSCT